MFEVPPPLQSRGMERVQETSLSAVDCERVDIDVPQHLTYTHLVRCWDENKRGRARRRSQLLLGQPQRASKLLYDREQ